MGTWEPSLGQAHLEGKGWDEGAGDLQGEMLLGMRRGREISLPEVVSIGFASGAAAQRVSAFWKSEGAASSKHRHPPTPSTHT